MNPPARTVLLVEDSDADNFLHQRAFARAQIDVDITVETSSERALEQLQRTAGTDDAPDLVFLDINMPRVNGWEVIDAFEQIPRDQRARTQVYVLTASANPADQVRGEAHPAAEGYLSKPLTAEMVAEICGTGGREEHPRHDPEP